MKLLNLDYVECDDVDGIALYSLGKLFWYVENDYDWRILLQSHVVHIARSYRADLSDPALNYEYPYTLSEIKKLVHKV